MLEAADFADLVAASGRSVTLRKVTQAAYDPLTDSFGTDTTTNTTVVAVIQNSMMRWRDGALVRVDERTALIAALGLAVAPEENDLLVDGASEYRVVTIREHKPGDALLGWNVSLG